MPTIGDLIAERLPDRDPKFATIMDELVRQWAEIPADDEAPLDVFGKFVRAAYGRGYSEALERRLA